jgi:transposase
MPDYELYIGIDWATEEHRVCCLNGDGQVCAELAVAHSGDGLEALVGELRARVGEAGRIAVGIETPHGAVVATLLAAGFHVFALNPKQLDRFRDRHTVAGAKDDRRDAFVLADALRTDRRAFRRLEPDDARVVQLRDMSRLHEELGQDVSRLTNRLREQLLRFYPQALALCPAADEAWLWSLLERAPTPGQAARLRPGTLRALLAEHRVRRFTADALQAALQATPLTVAAGTTEAAREHIALLLPRLRLVQEQRTHCERRLETLLTALAEDGGDADAVEHRDVTILRSLPGVGRVVAATMLAEASRLLASRDYQTLRIHAGVAPVTRQSGKSIFYLMRRSCNGRLRNAVFHWARNAVRLDARCRTHYARLRQAHGHARALRGVADRLLAMLIAMLANGTLYDAARRQPITRQPITT